MKYQVLILACLVAAVVGQQAGTSTAEEHLPLSFEQDTGSGYQTVQASVTMDSNWRWAHETDGYTNCYTGNEWDATLCPDSATCTQNCVIDGVDQATWTGTYGITSTGFELELKFVTQGPYSTNVGSRVYLLDSSESQYQMFYLKNRQFEITVDDSNLPCGLNGAMYFVEMEQDGGASSYGNAGAKYGLGYCDAQCPHDMKFINGEANSDGWVPSSNDVNGGTGKYGICCYEMDIWEANSMAQSYTPHDCSIQGYYRCEGVECGDNESGDRYNGVCDKDGCDFAAYRVGQESFYGPGLTIDSNQPVTIITQFITSDGTDSGDLVEIRRLYQQNGQIIQNVQVNFDGVTPYDSVTDAYCTDIKDLFGDVQDFAAKGGLKAMGDALDRGMVLVMSLWDDHYSFMHWLDAVFPDGSDPNVPGNKRGPCPADGGDPADLEANVPNSSVKFSGIRIGMMQSYD